MFGVGPSLMPRQIRQEFCIHSSCSIPNYHKSQLKHCEAISKCKASDIHWHLRSIAESRLSRTGVPAIMKTFKVPVCIGVVSVCGLLFAQQAPSAKPCPAEGFSGGFSYGCPQKQFANPSDV